ncbi:MAG: hypothetical protein E6K54_06660 [Gammaproteobacteria bacterium]|nr:MAG: hypothetical protein E6K54_06660 [Gammaproteobacteria bacterium]
MLNKLSLQINLESPNFLNPAKKRNLSPGQKIFTRTLEKTYNQLSELKKQNFFEFTHNNEFEISRGDFYALTDPLREKIDRERTKLEELRIALEQKGISLEDLQSACGQKANFKDLPTLLEQKKINLEDLQTVLEQKKLSLADLESTFELEKISLADLQSALENDLHIHDKKILSFILLCLVEPIWLPGALPALVLSLLAQTSYVFTNNNSGSLKVTSSEDNKQLVFYFELQIKRISDGAYRGLIPIHFSIDETMQVKLLPINLEFDFPNEQESREFQSALAQDFKTWLLSQNELENLPIVLDRWRAIQMDFCVFSISIGLLIGLSAMFSLIALGLTPISPLLLPPLGLALGLCLAGTLNTYAQVNIKKEREKTQRPIYLFNEKPMRTTTLFNQHRSQSAKASESKERSPRNLVFRKSPWLTGSQ